MAIAGSSTVLLVLACFLYNTFASAASIPYSSSAVASDQFKFWSKNVRNSMPKTVLSKLSPMSKHDSYYFSTLLSKKSFAKHAAFCSNAHLACSIDNGSSAAGKSDLHRHVKDGSPHKELKRYYYPYASDTVANANPTLAPSWPNSYAPYVAKESAIPESIKYKPYVAVSSSKGFKMNRDVPHAESKSLPSGLNSYNLRAVDSSKKSELYGYKPYVEQESRPSGLNSYKPYVENASLEPKINKYYPYVPKTSEGSDLSTYNPNVRDSTKKSELNGYMAYVAKDQSVESDLIKYNPYVAKDHSVESELINYKAYAEHPSQGSKVNRYVAYVKHASPRQSTSVDPRLFFRLSILERGNKVLLPSSLSYKLPDRAWLPTQIAKRISMTTNELKRIFPKSFVSPVTRNAILETLSYCNAPALKGDIKSCANSLEDMIKFSKSILGEQLLVALTTESEHGAGREMMMTNIKHISVKRYVACHELFLPFASHYCHFLESTRLYRVDFVDPETKIPVNKVLAMCHMETSAFPADHVSLEALNLSPGQGEVCHWLLPTEIVWIGEADYKA